VDRLRAIKEDCTATYQAEADVSVDPAAEL